MMTSSSINLPVWNFLNTMAVDALVTCIVKSRIQVAIHIVGKLWKSKYIFMFSEINSMQQMMSKYVSLRPKTSSVYSCTFDGSACGKEDFMPVMTDIGLCFVFNSNDSRVSTKPGIYIKDSRTAHFTAFLGCPLYCNLPICVVEYGIRWQIYWRTPTKHMKQHFPQFCCIYCMCDV